MNDDVIANKLNNIAQTKFKLYWKSSLIILLCNFFFAAYLYINQLPILIWGAHIIAIVGIIVNGSILWSLNKMMNMQSELPDKKKPRIHYRSILASSSICGIASIIFLWHFSSSSSLFVNILPISKKSHITLVLVNQSDQPAQNITLTYANQSRKSLNVPAYKSLDVSFARTSNASAAVSFVDGPHKKSAQFYIPKNHSQYLIIIDNMRNIVPAP